MAGEPHSNPTLLAPTPNGWRVAAIEELCEKVTSGGTPLRSDPSFYQDGVYSWFRTQALKDCVLFEADEKITEKALAQTSAKLFPKDTILMAMYGDGKTITSLGILAKEAATNQACCAMIPDRSTCDSRFLFYALKHHREDFLRIASGGAQRNLSGKLIRRFAINTPPLNEQRAIAHILGTLDDKIDLNRRMNETLEAMARALFKSWFVDFDPDRAKAERRDSGLPKPLADLFPDSFEDSELGEIPKGWATRELKEVLTESNERIGEVKAPEYSSTNNGLQLRSERFKKELSASSAKNKLIRNGFLVFGLSRRVLNFGLMRDSIGSVSSAYKVFAVNEEMVAPDLLERMMRLQPNYFYNAVSASSREGQSVSTEGLGLLRFVQPAPAVQDAFYRITDPLSGRINALQEQSRSLVALRDTLLPKLISGEIRIGGMKSP